MPRDEIDLLVLATLSPDYLLPATAPTVQDRLGLNCAAMDVGAACAGFMYALVTGMQYVATGASKYALVIGSDTNSRVMNPADKKTYPLFGDGAGAVLVTKGSPEQGLLAYTLGADGSGDRLLVRPEGGSRTPLAPASEVSMGWFVKMDGRPVFKWAVRLLEDSSQQVLEAAGFTNDDVELWLLHQANIRILDAATDALEIDRQRVDHATSTATATRRPAACRSRSTKRCATAASRGRSAADVRLRRRTLVGHGADAVVSEAVSSSVRQSSVASTGSTFDL